MFTLKQIYSKWELVAYKIANFQAKFLLMIFYFIILFPVGIVFSFFKDKLKIKKNYSTTWVNKENSSDTIDKLRHQY